MQNETQQSFNLNVAQALELALRLHKDGRLAEAEHVYQEVLRGDPANISALHYLGIVMIQMGQPEDAVVLINKALGRDPQNATMYNHLGEALRLLGRIEEALEQYEHAVQIDANMIEAHNNWGVALTQLGRFQEALSQFDQAIAKHELYAEAHNNRGVVLEQLGRLDDAAEAYANAVKKKRNYDEARSNFDTVVRKLGTQSQWAKRLSGEMEEMFAVYEQLVKENPGDADAHNTLGVLLSERFRFEDAMGHYRQAVMLRPDFVEAVNNIGVALHELERPAEAIPYYRRALELRPDDPQIHCNLGAAMQETLDLAGSEAELETTIELKPDYPEAHYNLALLQLATGRFADGWKNYIWRGSLKDKTTAFGLATHPLPADMGGKRVHLYRNQGLGDEIFFLRFAQELKRRNAWVSYTTSSSLYQLVSRLPFLDEVIIKGHPEPADVDYRFSVADLPVALGMKGWEDIPASISLTESPDVLAKIMHRLADFGEAPLMGVTWRAGTQSKAKFGKHRLPFKQLDLVQLASAMKGYQGEVVILQRNPEPGEIEQFTQALGRPVVDLSDLNENLDEMLAVLSVLDEYAGVSNTNMHLYAALGKAARVLIPTSILDWRWLSQGKQSPWFPGFCIYRQQGDGTWGVALSELKKDLEKS